MSILFQPWGDDLSLPFLLSGMFPFPLFSLNIRNHSSTCLHLDQFLFLFTFFFHRPLKGHLNITQPFYKKIKLVTFSGETVPQVCYIRSYWFLLCSLGLWLMPCFMYGFSVLYFLSLSACDGLFRSNPAEGCWLWWYIFIFMSEYSRKLCQWSADVCLTMDLEN